MLGFPGFSGARFDPISSPHSRRRHILPEVNGPPTVIDSECGTNIEAIIIGSF
jgi:hypothetical protein